MIATSVENAWSKSAMAKTLHSPQRYRGFVLTAAGLQKLHEQIKQLEGKTRRRQSPRTIAERVQLSEPEGIHPITVRKILNGENGVDKRSIQLIFQVLQIQLEEGDYAHAGLYQQPTEAQSSEKAPAEPPVETVSLLKSQGDYWNWSEVMGEFDLIGRVDELAQLNQAIITERCQFIQILGVAGIGKTALATLLARAVGSEFEFVIWKSLHHAPALPIVLTSILHLLGKQTGESIKLPAHTEELKGLLIEQLQKHRCLLVFDHFDSILCSKQYTGYCRQGYEAYSDLLRVVAEVSHQSCLVITSREKPRVPGIEADHRIRSLQLSGLSSSECQQLYGSHRNLIGSADEWRSLVERCGGNWLVLKTIVIWIQDYFNGRIADYLLYLRHGRLLFGELRDLLSQQFERLSPVERELVCRLALYQAPVLMSQFRKDMTSAMTQQYWLEGLDSLSRRSLLHRQAGYLSLDLMMQIYVNECLVEPGDTASSASSASSRDSAPSKLKLKLVSSQTGEC
jgi:hypothetical protein